MSDEDVDITTGWFPTAIRPTGDHFKTIVDGVGKLSYLADIMSCTCN